MNHTDAFINNYFGSQKHKICMISHACTYLPLPIIFKSLKAKENFIKIQVQGAGDVFSFWTTCSIWKHRPFPTFTKIVNACRSFNFTDVFVISCYPYPPKTAEKYFHRPFCKTKFGERLILTSPELYTICNFLFHNFLLKSYIWSVSDTPVNRSALFSFFFFFPFCYFHHRIINVYVQHCNIHSHNSNNVVEVRRHWYPYIINETNKKQTHTHTQMGVKEMRSSNKKYMRKKCGKFCRSLMQCLDLSIASFQKSLNKEQNKMTYFVLVCLKYIEKNELKKKNA